MVELQAFPQNVLNDWGWGWGGVLESPAGGGSRLFWPYQAYHMRLETNVHLL